MTGLDFCCQLVLQPLISGGKLQFFDILVFLDNFEVLSVSFSAFIAVPYTTVFYLKYICYPHVFPPGETKWGWTDICAKMEGTRREGNKPVGNTPGVVL